MKLNYDFFNNNVVDVAKDLLGKKLVFGKYEGFITETEAYGGEDDEASHAFCGATKRSKIMFGPPGYAYIYMIYGMYHCFNIVAENIGKAGAVLIRGLKLSNIYLDGPGKLCRHIGMNMEHNGVNLIQGEKIYLMNGYDITKYKCTSRVGINKAKDKLWRFIINKEDVYMLNNLING